VLRGETEVALERERSGPEYKASLNLIKDEAERLSRIVEDLFILARRPPDGPAIVSQPVRLDKVVSDCARAAEVLARRKDLKLSFEGCATKISLQGDDEMLKRMLLNLLDNAVKYTPAGGEIRVALSVPNGHARIAVTDNGIGISDADQRNIFDRFYRVDKARSRSLGGAGLGLSIVWWIVNAHGGTVSVDSQPGLGSTFEVELPIKS
jgi:signal transduction histidine kinase